VGLRQLGKDLAVLPQEALAAVDEFVQELAQRQQALAGQEPAPLIHRARSLGFEDVERVAREVPEPTRFILHKLLRPEPAERYATAGALERALRERLRVPDPDQISTQPHLPCAGAGCSSPSEPA
jgi:hypothetical protein